MQNTINSSWIASKFANGEVNSQIPYVAVNEPEFFAQGDEAQEIIDQLGRIWSKNEVLNNEEVFNLWVFFNIGH